MPQYKLMYNLVYTVPASSDSDANRVVVAALEVLFPDVDGRGKVLSVQQSPTQDVLGSTLYDVSLVVSGVVPAVSVAESTTIAIIPPTIYTANGIATLTSITQMGSLDTDVPMEAV